MRELGLPSVSAAVDVTEVSGCAVLVCSCDAYQDLWKPFFQLFWRYWPDCPFRIYLGANDASMIDDRVVTLHTGSDRSWSANLRMFLQEIGTEYVLLLLEDYFLDERVRTEDVLGCLSTLRALGGSVLRLFPNPGPDQPIVQPPDDHSRGVGIIDRLAPYRVSAQPAIWKREHLLALLDARETAWEFEWNGTERSRSTPFQFLSTYRPVLHYRHVVERGRWFWSAARHYRAEDIGCDFSVRPIMGPLTAAKKSLNCFRKNLVDAILPPRLRRRR